MNTPDSEEKPEEKPQKMSLEESQLVKAFFNAQGAKDILLQKSKSLLPNTKIQDISLEMKNHIKDILDTDFIEEHTQNTIQESVNILYKQMDEYSVQLQKKTQEKYIAEGKVTPGPQRLFENKRKELVASRSFFHLVQLAFSPEDCYLSSTTLSQDDPNYRDAVVIAPSKIKNIYKQIGLNHLRADCAVFKSFLSKFKPLKYTFQGEERITNRIGTIIDKALCFGVATIPFKEEEPLTPGERRKKEYITFAEVFDNVYDLQRDQQHILTNFDKKLTDHEDVNEQVKALFDAETDGLRAMYVDTKDGAKKRKLEGLFEQFQNETSFYTRTALLFQFRKISGQNVERDNQHLLAGLRQLGKRGEEIANMFALISAQLDEIEEYIHQEKYANQLFLSLYTSFYTYPMIQRVSYKDINDTLVRYLTEAKSNNGKSFTMQPYATFYEEMSLIAGPLQDIPHGRGKKELQNPINDKSRLITLQAIFLSQFTQYKAYEIENDLKTGKMQFSTINKSYLSDKLNKKELHDCIDDNNLSPEFGLHCLLDLVIEASYCTSETALYEVLEKIQKHEIV